MRRQLFSNICLANMWVFALAALQPDLSFPKLFILVFYWLLLCMFTVFFLRRYANATSATDIVKHKFTLTVIAAIAVSAIFSVACAVVDIFDIAGSLCVLGIINLMFTTVLGKWAVKS